MKWTPKDYSLLELVGKSRNFGIMRHILNTSFAAEQKGMKAFHLIKSLKKLGFLILEVKSIIKLCCKIKLNRAIRFKSLGGNRKHFPYTLYKTIVLGVHNSGAKDSVISLYKTRVNIFLTK